MTCKWLHAFNLYIYNLYVVVGHASDDMQVKTLYI